MRPPASSAAKSWTSTTADRLRPRTGTGETSYSLPTPPELRLLPLIVTPDGALPLIAPRTERFSSSSPRTERSGDPGSIIGLPAGLRTAAPGPGSQAGPNGGAGRQMRRAGRQMGGPGDKWGGRATNGGAGRQMGGPGDKWGGRATNGGAGRQIGGPGRQIGGPEMRSDPNGFRSNSEIDSIVIYRYRMTMEDIDPKLLRTFLYVARERKFSAAARLLGLSPSTVSLRIRTLERRLGCPAVRPQRARRDPGPFGFGPVARRPGNRRDKRSVVGTRGFESRPGLRPARRHCGFCRTEIAAVSARPHQNWRTKLSSARLRS